MFVELNLIKSSPCKAQIFGEVGSFSSMMSSRTQFFSFHCLLCFSQCQLSPKSGFSCGPRQLYLQGFLFKYSRRDTDNLSCSPSKSPESHSEPKALVTVTVAKGIDVLMAQSRLGFPSFPPRWNQPFRNHMHPQTEIEGLLVGSGGRGVENACSHYSTRCKNMLTKKSLPGQADRVWEIPPSFFLVYVTRAEDRLSLCSQIEFISIFINWSFPNKVAGIL